MKLQPESKKELLRIAGGTAFCTAIMWVLFAALHLVGWVKFDYTVVLGSLVGAAVAIGNFAGICFVVQKIIDEPDEKRRKATLQLSYNSRMLLQALWVVVAVAAPCFQPFASVLPLFFPRVTIYYLQMNVPEIQSDSQFQNRPKRTRHLLWYIFLQSSFDLKLRDILPAYAVPK